eukprot:TRINITY_DN9350_c0_g3_i1.p1 TRINITY_DN9350_c0_g3~~TRINITY_DN9350_c0_g3_i1.p1  ORF type:complete len:216 (+),score=28.20 TRINITY_DN9350_c0_g3_i1:125-772(+)
MVGLCNALVMTLGASLGATVWVQSNDIPNGTIIDSPNVIVRRPGDFIANDLWGIRDLVLSGYAALFMRRESEGARNVRTAGFNLVELLPKLHPVALCRQKIDEAIKNTANGTTRISFVAQAAWSCLPGNFTPNHFDTPFLDEYLDDYEKAKASKMVHLNDPSVLSACKDSAWPRTCSYWSSMHAMAYRADALNLSKPFLRAIFPILASGTIQCVG